MNEFHNLANGCKFAWEMVQARWTGPKRNTRSGDLLCTSSDMSHCNSCSCLFKISFRFWTFTLTATLCEITTVTMFLWAAANDYFPFDYFIWAIQCQKLKNFPEKFPEPKVMCLVCKVIERCAIYYWRRDRKTTSVHIWEAWTRAILMNSSMIVIRHLNCKSAVWLGLLCYLLTLEQIQSLVWMITTDTVRYCYIL